MNEFEMTIGSVMVGFDNGMFETGDMEVYGTETGTTQAKDPLLSSWLFVGGITALSLACSIVIGVLFAKRKIKKGFDLYED